MGYRFEGVFIENPAKNEAELEELFDGYARKIATPFIGAVVSFKSCHLKGTANNEANLGNEPTTASPVETAKSSKIAPKRK